ARTRRFETLKVAKVEFAEKVRLGTTEISAQEAEETKVSEKLRALEATMEQVQTSLTEVVTGVKTTEGDIAVARERRRALTEQQEFQAREIGLLRSRITATQQKLEEDRKTFEQARN